MKTKHLEKENANISHMLTVAIRALTDIAENGANFETKESSNLTHSHQGIAKRGLGMLQYLRCGQKAKLAQETANLADGVVAAKGFNIDEIQTGSSAVSSSAGLDCYVRCRYCDSNFSNDNELPHKSERPKDSFCAHEKVAFICPACGLFSNSYVFHT